MTNEIPASSPVNPPRAWLLGDFTEHRDAFTVSGHLSKIRSAFSKANSIHTQADETTMWVTSGMEKDPVAREYYRTIRQVIDDKTGLGSSLHEMYLDSEDPQIPHYHPNESEGEDKDNSSSRRIVILFPLHNKDTGDSGIEMTWFALENIKFTGHRVNNLTVNGDPVSPAYTLPLLPGMLVAVEIDEGAHCFSKGVAVALSIHPKDYHKMKHSIDTLVDNTFVYTGSMPDEKQEIEPDRTGVLPTNPRNDEVFRTSFLRCATIAEQAIEAGPVPDLNAEELVALLRAAIAQQQPSVAQGKLPKTSIDPTTSYDVG